MFINPNVYADLNHLYMLNFSVPQQLLRPRVPQCLQLVTKNGRAFPSVVLPCIENLRSVHCPWPRFSYEFMGVRILVHYKSKTNDWMKGIYFDRLFMDPNHVRLLANMMTDFHFEPALVQKSQGSDEWSRISVYSSSRSPLLSVECLPSGEGTLLELPDNSEFESAAEAKRMFNDIAFGFLPGKISRGSLNILQIADPHPDYEKWPLVDMQVRSLNVSIPGLPIDRCTLEPSYYVGALPRWWRGQESRGFTNCRHLKRRRFSRPKR